MKKSVSLICSELQGEARRAVTFFIQSIGVVVVEVKVRRNVAGGLGSEAKKLQLVVVILSWPGFERV